MTYIPALSFGWLTRFFDPLVDLMGFSARRRAQVVQLLAPQPGERVLDVGAGTGTLLAAIGHTHRRAIAAGVEIDDQALALAQDRLRRQHVGVRLTRGSAAALPYRSGSVDAVVSTLVIHHLPTAVKQQALAEIHRVLRPGGRFLLVDLGAAEGLALRLFSRTLAALGLFGLAEARTAADNLSGRLPGFLADAGFSYREVARPVRGVHSWLAVPNESRGPS